MRSLTKKLILGTSLVFFLLPLDATPPTTGLLTMPRSGTNLFIFTTNFFFGQPYDGLKEDGRKLSPNDKRLVVNRLSLPLDPSKDYIYRSHHRVAFTRDTDRLIYILRDYKANVINQVTSFYPKTDYQFVHRFSNSSHLFGYYLEYIQRLQFYKNWSKDKLLIYFEDLVTSPLSEMNRFAKFMNYTPPDPSRLPEYLSLRDKNYKSYITQHNTRVQISSMDPYSHQKKFSPEARKKVDKQVYMRHPSLRPYLERYFDLDLTK